MVSKAKTMHILKAACPSLDLIVFPKYAFLMLDACGKRTMLPDIPGSVIHKCSKLLKHKHNAFFNQRGLF